MAHKRFTDTNIWDKDWFMELKPKYKCLIKYLFDKCDSCGAWKPNWKLASLHINESVSADDLKEIPADQYEILPNGKIFLPDFINFQYVTLSRKSPAHNPVFLALEKNNLSDRVLDGVFTTPKDKDKDKDKDNNTSNGIQKFLVGDMMAVWVKEFPTYSRDAYKDSLACRSVADFFFTSEGIINGHGNKESEKKAVESFKLVAKEVGKDKFWKNKSLTSISNNIQEFYNRIKNPGQKQNFSQNGRSNSSTVGKTIEFDQP